MLYTLFECWLQVVLFLQRSYAERVRGEARKKWLQLIVNAGETGGVNMEPVYKAVFQALYKVGKCSIFFFTKSFTEK